MTPTRYPVEIDRESFFKHAFSHLSSGRSPYPWQRWLFLDMTSGNWPLVVPLPTGSGKISVLQIWLIVLAWCLREGIAGIPRRLAWVVNCRVVVDQVREEAERLPELLKTCQELHDPLKQASSSGQTLAVSTLRGQRADNGDWALAGCVAGSDSAGTRIRVPGGRRFITRPSNSAFA
jgi:CRISPR-associated endonuclease/helicase Cas3